MTACQSPTPPDPNMPSDAYSGDDLGLTYSPQRSIFKVWSPVAAEMKLHIYDDGDIEQQKTPSSSHIMTKDAQNVWSVELNENLLGKFYTFQITKDGKLGKEAPDPYAIATGVNGHRAMVVDLKETNPADWSSDQRPPLARFTDIVIYELHVRDLSSHPSSGIVHQKKFLGLTETGTTNPAHLATGLDHIKALGATHVHLLPSFDFMPRSINEAAPNDRFNWGYDPQNYNVPEGAYATNPFDGRVRIQEFKTMVKALHDNGLRVIMDVVYNHTGETEGANFNALVPNYYYRMNADGTFSNASGCGNETASEKYMMRKFMVESMRYWVEEYHVDGFRVDLMGIHDIETMNQISTALHEIDPTIFIYGEGWTAGDSPLPVEQRALKAHTAQLKNIAAFSDDIRDGLKGSVFNHQEAGFVNGKSGMEETVKFGVVAATEHPQIDYAAVNYSNHPWSPAPTQTITYVSCHDNHTLYDKLLLTNPNADEATRLQMQRLALSIVLTSQGVPFLHAGVELARTKQGVENSFEHPDSINQIDWNRKSQPQYLATFEYVQQLIELRKAHPAFRMTTTQQIQQHLQFFENLPNHVVAYQMSDNANGDAWKDIIVIYNANPTATRLNLNEDNWQVAWNGSGDIQAAATKVRGNNLEVAPISMMVLFKQ